MHFVNELTRASFYYRSVWYTTIVALNGWNRLPGDCVNATSANKKKILLENYFFKYGYLCLDVSPYLCATGHSIRNCFPCPVPSLVPNLLELRVTIRLYYVTLS